MPLSGTSICTAGAEERVALGIAGNHQDAEDMLHEAFEEAFGFQACI